MKVPRLQNGQDLDPFVGSVGQFRGFRLSFWRPGSIGKLLFFLLAVMDLEKLRTIRYLFQQFEKIRSAQIRASLENSLRKSISLSRPYLINACIGGCLF